MPGLVEQLKECVYFVGGRGSKAGDANAGGCLKTYWGDLHSPNKLLSDVMGSNGEPISDSSTWNGSQTACTVSNNGSGYTRITKTGGFSNCEIGQIANVKYAPPTGDGRYEVTAVNANYVDLDSTTPLSGTADIKVGGAFDKIQTIADASSASRGTTPQDIHILTNKAETFSGSGDRIDIDAGGGSQQFGTWKRIIGIGDDGKELPAGYFNIIDGNNQNCHVFYINNISNIELRHIHAKDANSSAYNDINIEASAVSKGFLFKGCKTSGGQYGIYAGDYNAYMVHIEGGQYSSAGGTAIYSYQCRHWHLKDVELVGATTSPLIFGYVVGIIELDGCVVRKTANHTLGLDLNYPTTLGIVKNCVFYDIDSCIRLNDNEAKLIHWNNTYVLHTAASGVFINQPKGTIIYRDYNCGWAIDGTPSASNRWGKNGIGPNSFEKDPVFRNASNLDFRYKASSPCLNKGHPTLGGLI